MIRISMSCTSMTFYIKIHRSVNPWLPGTNAPPIASGCRSASWSAMPPPIENPFINLFRQKGSEESCFENWLKQESIGKSDLKAVAPSPPMMIRWGGTPEACTCTTVSKSHQVDVVKNDQLWLAIVNIVMMINKSSTLSTITTMIYYECYYYDSDIQRLTSWALWLLHLLLWILIVSAT